MMLAFENAYFYVIAFIALFMFMADVAIVVFVFI